MGVDEVLHVDVVPDAGAVRRGVVGTEELQAVPPALRHRQDERDEVGLRPVILADGAVRPGPRHVEVPQGAVFQAIGPVAPLEHFFHDELALAVGVGGHLRVVLLNGSAHRLTEGGRRGGKDQIGHLVGHHGADKCQPGGDVVAEIFVWDGHGLPHQRIGGEMDDRLHIFPGKDPVEEMLVGHVADVEPPALHRLTVALGQVVHHHHVRAPVQQGGHAVGPDITGAAGHKNCHGNCSFRAPRALIQNMSDRRDPPRPLSARR